MHVLYTLINTLPLVAQKMKKKKNDIFISTTDNSFIPIYGLHSAQGYNIYYD